MQGNIGLSIATTTSGMIGGVTKAVSANLTVLSISFQGIIDVAFYALVSASVGYGVKVGFDRLVKRRKSQKRSS
jgi:hypothetical protein